MERQRRAAPGAARRKGAAWIGRSRGETASQGGLARDETGWRALRAVDVSVGCIRGPAPNQGGLVAGRTQRSAERSRQRRGRRAEAEAARSSSTRRGWAGAGELGWRSWSSSGLAQVGVWGLGRSRGLCGRRTLLVNWGPGDHSSRLKRATGQAPLWWAAAAGGESGPGGGRCLRVRCCCCCSSSGDEERVLRWMRDCESDDGTKAAQGWQLSLTRSPGARTNERQHRLALRHTNGADAGAGRPVGRSRARQLERSAAVQQCGSVYTQYRGSKRQWQRRRARWRRGGLRARRPQL